MLASVGLSPSLPAVWAIVDKWLAGTSTPHRRVALAVAFSLHAGLRLREAFGVRKGDVNLAARELTVRTDTAKNSKRRVVPINDRLYEARWFGGSNECFVVETAVLKFMRPAGRRDPTVPD